MTDELTIMNPTLMELMILSDIAETKCPADEHIIPSFTINGEPLYDIFWLDDHYINFTDEDKPTINEISLMTYTKKELEKIMNNPPDKDEFAEYAAQQCTGDGIEPYGHTPPC